MGNKDVAQGIAKKLEQREKQRTRLFEDIVAHLGNETNYSDFVISGTIKGSGARTGIETVAGRVTNLVMVADGAAKRARETERHAGNE